MKTEQLLQALNMATEMNDQDDLGVAVQIISMRIQTKN